MKRKILVAAMLFALAAPTQAVMLRWAAQNDILTLDPHSQNHATTISIMQHCYEALVRYDKKFQIEPGLAASWEQVTPTQWRFKLRQNVKFHDGSPFTADDVVFSYVRIKQPQGTMQPVRHGRQRGHEGRRPHGRLHPRGPEPGVPAQPGRVPHHEQDLGGEEQVGKGPGLQGEREHVRLAQHQRHRRLHDQIVGAGQAGHDGRESELVGQAEGNATEVIYSPIKSDATRVAALLAGDVDLVTDLPTQDVERLKKEPKLKVLDGAENRTIFIALDQGSDELKYADVKGKNPFKDIRVRRALNMAVDRETIKKVTMRGLSIPGGLMIAPQVHGYDKAIDKLPPVDVNAAKKLLAEAGYPNGFGFRLNCPNNRYVNDEKICQALVGMWARIGVKATLAAEPMATFIAKVQNFDTSAYMLGWGVATFDALYMLQALARTKTTGADGSFNFVKLSDPKLDQIIDTMKTEMDAKKRDALIKDALVMVRDQYYFVPLHYQLRPWAMKKNVTTIHRANDAPESRVREDRGAGQGRQVASARARRPLASRLGPRPRVELSPLAGDHRRRAADADLRRQRAAGPLGRPAQSVR
jgi:peptide/nickel transport system substrate-binding protein